MHPQHARDKPFYPSLTEAPNHDVAEAENSVKKLIDFDAREDILVVIAHDGSLLDVLDFFPKQANDWKEKGWKEEGKWRFLRDFQQGEL
jgi:glyoxylase-like metal-dependent hydrolase (beta-lactamase superfamily II)